MWELQKELACQIAPSEDIHKLRLVDGCGFVEPTPLPYVLPYVSEIVYIGLHLNGPNTKPQLLAGFSKLIDDRKLG